MSVFMEELGLEELGLTAYATTWKCPHNIDIIPEDHAALIGYAARDTVRLTDDEFGNARWATWQALDLHSALFPNVIDLHPSSQPWHNLADTYYRSRGGTRARVRAETLHAQQELERRNDRSSGFQRRRRQEEAAAAGVVEADSSNGSESEGRKLDAEETVMSEELNEKNQGEQIDVEEPDEAEVPSKKVDKRFRKAEKGPRCQFCKVSRKGCDGKQPCGRCVQSGRQCVPEER